MDVSRPVLVMGVVLRLLGEGRVHASAPIPGEVFSVASMVF